jgi:hypothetical protein
VEEDQVFDLYNSQLERLEDVHFTFVFAEKRVGSVEVDGCRC